MTMTKIYEDENNEMVAVVYEDGECVNYVPCPEMAALEADSFLEEARLGFPEALLYEMDIQVGRSMEEAAKQEEQNSTLIAEVGDEITLYPHRMSEEHQEFFAIDLGEDVWQELMEQASGDEGVQLDLE